MQNKDHEKRDQQIREWRKAGIPQTEMARLLKITRQRVQQIERRLGLGLRRKPGVYKEYITTCRQCKKQVRQKIAGRIYCSRECFFESRKIHRTPEEEERRSEEKKEKNRLRSQKYYYEVFKKSKDWKRVVKKRNEQYAKNKK